MFFDIEVYALRDVCYLHGFIERPGRDNGSERFLNFFTPDTTREAEEVAFPQSMAYMRQAQPCAIFYYSKYECIAEWPTSDSSIETLAKYLGFRWRDTHPSGIASIQWFDGG